MKKYPKCLNKISFEKVEGLRKLFDFKVSEMAEMLGFSTRHYSRCRRRGFIDAFRYYGVKHAMMAHVMQESHDKLKILSKF